MEMTSTLRQALAEALTEYTTNLDEVALIEAIASRAFCQWVEAEGLVVVPIHSTLQMDEAGSKEAQMAHAEGISVDAEVMWDFMIAAAPDVLGKP